MPDSSQNPPLPAALHRAILRRLIRAAEFEARLQAVEAESQALKGEVVESAHKEKSLRQEVASLKVFHVLY